MKIHIITIGDEILIGQIVDTNSAWMGTQLNANGGHIIGITTVGDEEQAIREAVKNALQKADAVLLTGGLGPTKDDITKKTLADLMGVEMLFSALTFERITKIFEGFGRKTTPAHREQCYMPANATLLHNKQGTAPGMWFEYDNKVIVSMPGVPHEMKYLMEFEVIPKLKNRFQTVPIAHRTILTVGEGETRIAVRIEDFVDQLPPYFKVAYLPGLGQVRVRLTATHEDVDLLNQELDEKRDNLIALIPELVYGEGTDSLPKMIGRMLQEKRLTLGTAESCTGGHLAHLITSVSGSSAYFMGSVVTYSNDMKIRQLSVQAETLAQFGAVCEQTVREMVIGGLDLLKTDVVIAISGIAGPTGGTPEKPVGTIWMAIGNKDEIKTRKLNLGKDRLRNIQYTSVQGLNLIRQFVAKLKA